MRYSRRSHRTSIDDGVVIGIGNTEDLPRPQIDPEYVVVVNRLRKYVEVSSAFCKLLGYREDELIGKLYDDFTVPRTNNIPTVMGMLVKYGYMHGIWVFSHRRGTKILVRYEAFARFDGLYEARMELLGAGA
jgi:PAS domain S-box-containing protein